jgi:quercetin dioxygenase-like cupin family protein
MHWSRCGGIIPEERVDLLGEAEKGEYGTMADSETLKAKSMDSADETRTFDNGRMDIVHIDEVTAGRVTLEPGWRWSEAIKPIAKTDSCQVQHTGYVVSGRMKIVMDDGSEQEIGPGDVYVIRPGHDAWVVGEETYVGVDFSSDMERFAKEQQ